MATRHSATLAVPLPETSRTCAAIVLFHPDEGFCARLENVVRHFASVVLIDNTPGNAELGELTKNVHVIRNGTNLGIAAALNQGIDFALENDFSWLATFDQDSDLLDGYLDKVISIAAGHSPQPVLVGCNYLNADNDTADCVTPPEHVDALPRLTVITSGTFLPAEFARSIGGFREDYFIDSVDHEFCLRARSHGAMVLMTTQPLMRHRMGVGAVGIGRPFSRQHSSLRRYYIVRNTLATIRANMWRHPLWSLRQLARLLAEVFAIVAFERGKAPKLRACLYGFWHGVIGKSGPCCHVE